MKSLFFAFTDRHYVEKMRKRNVLAIYSKSASFLWETVYRRNLRRCLRCCWTCAAEFCHQDHLDHLYLLQHFTPHNPIRVYTLSSLMFHHLSYSHYGVNINNTSNHIIKILISRAVEMFNFSSWCQVLRLNIRKWM